MSASVSAFDDETTSIVDHAKLAIDYTDILTTLESEIAAGLKKSRDAGIEAVTKAYDLYDGDFCKFNESNCFMFLEQQMVLDVMGEYEHKSQIMGMSAKDLNLTTAGVLATKFAGREAELSSMMKLKIA
jgi:hypothetical protein